MACDGITVGRIFKPAAGAPSDTPWFWSITALERRSGPGPHHGYERAAAMQAFAASWHRESG